MNEEKTIAFFNDVESIYTPFLNKWSMERDPSERGYFPRLYRRSIINGVGRFIDISVCRDDFTPSFQGEFPDDIMIEIWCGIYSQSDPSIGYRECVVPSTSMRDLNSLSLVDYIHKCDAIFEKWDFNKLMLNRPTF